MQVVVLPSSRMSGLVKSAQEPLPYLVAALVAGARRPELEAGL